VLGGQHCLNVGKSTHYWIERFKDVLKSERKEVKKLAIRIADETILKYNGNAVCCLRRREIKFI